MKKTHNYEHCYQILQINSDVTFTELRKSYKRAIQKWHPDRFEEGSKEKLAADNKIKKLNAAYKILVKYHKEHGSLPSLLASKPSSNKTVANSNTGSDSFNTKYQEKKAKRQNIKKSSISFRLKALTIAAAAIYIALSYIPLPIIDSDTSTNLKMKTPNSKPDNLTNRLMQEPISSFTGDKKPLDHNIFFTKGSTFGDVISIQGTPTSTEGQIWFYGNSEVHFHEGRVTHWKRSNDINLKAKLR